MLLDIKIFHVVHGPPRYREAQNLYRNPHRWEEFTSVKDNMFCSQQATTHIIVISNVCGSGIQVDDWKYLLRPFETFVLFKTFLPGTGSICIHINVLDYQSQTRHLRGIHSLRCIGLFDIKCYKWIHSFRNPTHIGQSLKKLKPN